jgi:phosphate starvation-inducible PhoH-like protein
MSNAKRSAKLDEGKNKKDTSIYTFKDGQKLGFDLNIRENIPFTDKQKEFFELFGDKKTKLILLRGPAGTSKTLISVYAALHLLNERKMDKILYVRSAVESADTKLLALPGSIEDKMAPFFAPLKEKLEELLPENQIKALLNGGFVEGTPISYLRGRSFGSNKVIIGDEIQSLTYREIISLLTRISEFSKMILIFDPKQSDLPEGKMGAINKIWDAFSDQESFENGIRTFSFGPEDIVRSELVKFIVKKLGIYE